VSFRDLGQLLDAAATSASATLSFHGRRSADPVAALTAAELRDAALGRLASLEAAGIPVGAVVLLQLADARDLVVSSWACVLGGLVAVPLAPGSSRDAAQRVASVQRCLSDAWLLGDRETLSALARHGVTPPAARTLVLEGLPLAAAADARRATNPTAYLQCSSGSTSAPKPVVLRHAQVLANVTGIRRAVAGRAGEVSLNWMPLTHDMGWVGTHLVPLAVGAAQHHLPPLAFMRRPERWLALASQLGATSLSATAFALERTLDRLAGTDLTAWDLSRVERIVLGAEPISAEACRAFARRLAPAGLRPNVFQPAYGLAEATLAVTMAPVGAPLRAAPWARSSLGLGSAAAPAEAGAPEAVELVDCGAPVDGVALQVVDAVGQPVADGVVGRVQIRGACVSPGYAHGADLSDAALDRGAWSASDWHDTGDLGFLRGGRLTVAGRCKEVVFVGGQNVHLHDVDRLARGLAGPRALDLAAASVPGPGGQARVLVCVRHRGDPAAARPLAADLRRGLYGHLGLTVRVVPVARVPRTTSGKPQRFALAERYLRGDYDEALADLEAAPLPAEAATVADRLVLVQEVVEELTGLQVPADASFLEAGVGSLALVDVASRLEALTGRALDAADLIGYPTPRQIAGLLAEASAPSTTGPSASLDRDGDDAVAVVGLAVRTPLGGDLDGFWAGLLAGQDAVGEFPQARRDDLARWSRGTLRPGAYLERVDRFDPEAFGIDEAEARVLHPAQRLLLELAAQATANAGMEPGELAGAGTGVFVGGLGDVEGARWRAFLDEAAPAQAARTLAGSLSTFLAGRLAHALDVRGPVSVVDTACSASLVAVHQACRALRAGECDVALAGGARVCLVPGADGLRLGIESPTGRARAFGDGADGTVLGEGGALLVLKPLRAALAEGHTIHAVIRGSAVNHDGRAATVFAPNPVAQEELLERAWSVAGLDAGRLAFVEAHGTGTRLGDAVELRALSAALTRRGVARCAVGSIKSNLGHLFEAAGVVGLAKAILALQHRRLPATLHAETPSAHLPAGGPLAVASRAEDLAPGVVQAGVSAFGISGTNCHVVVETAPPHRVRRAPLPCVLRPRRVWLEELTALSAPGPAAAHVEPAPPPAPTTTAGTLERLRRVIEAAAELELPEDPTVCLLDAGLDSIVAVQVQQRIEEAFGVSLPDDLLYDDDELTLERLTARIDADAEPTPRPAAPAASAPSEAAAAPAPAPATAELRAKNALEKVPAEPLVLDDAGRAAVGDLVADVVARLGDSREVAARTRDVLACNRNVAGFRAAWKDAVFPLVADRAEGAWLIDADGNRVLDICMGFGVHLLGHAPAAVHDAVAAELRRGAPLGPMTALAGDVAARIARLTGVERVAFVNTGTEAVMLALRVARAVTGRRKVAVFRGSYHGTFDGVLAVPAAQGDGAAAPAAPGTTPGAVEDTLVLDYGSPAALETLRAHAGELAAVLVEPVQSRRPDLVPVATR
jgi:3-oxoacyl-(acyl-carrier-protein) synthase/acyl-CoA synthetase (AMP-forming)/AMP-acid ligase II/acyl carrier protein